MATPAKTPPAQVVHRHRVGNCHLSVFEDGKATLQRSYVHAGAAGFAHSLHLKDVDHAIAALEEFKRWAAQQKEAASS